MKFPRVCRILLTTTATRIHGKLHVLNDFLKISSAHCLVCIFSPAYPTHILQPPHHLHHLHTRHLCVVSSHQQNSWLFGKNFREKFFNLRQCWERETELSQVLLKDGISSVFDCDMVFMRIHLEIFPFFYILRIRDKISRTCMNVNDQHAICFAAYYYSTNVKLNLKSEWQTFSEAEKWNPTYLA